MRVAIKMGCGRKTRRKSNKSQALSEAKDLPWLLAKLVMDSLRQATSASLSPVVSLDFDDEQFNEPNRSSPKAQESLAFHVRMLRPRMDLSARYLSKRTLRSAERSSVPFRFHYFWGLFSAPGTQDSAGRQKRTLIVVSIAVG